jgi:hypothetical protein
MQLPYVTITVGSGCAGPRFVSALAPATQAAAAHTEDVCKRVASGNPKAWFCLTLW